MFASQLRRCACNNGRRRDKDVSTVPDDGGGSAPALDFASGYGKFIRLYCARNRHKSVRLDSYNNFVNAVM